MAVKSARGSPCKPLFFTLHPAAVRGLAVTLAAPPVVPLLLPLQSRNLQIDDVLFRLHPVKAGVAGLSRRGGRRRNVGRLYPSEAYVTLNSEQRKAMADQLS